MESKSSLGHSLHPSYWGQKLQPNLTCWISNKDTHHYSPPYAACHCVWIIFAWFLSDGDGGTQVQVTSQHEDATNLEPNARREKKAIRD